MESVIKTIRIFGRERKFEDVQGKERTCVFYSFTKDGKNFIQIKFPQACEDKPRKAGYFLITFAIEDASYQKSKNPKFNDVIWVNNVKEIKEDTEYAEKLAKEKTRRLEEMLTSDNDLPF